MYTHTLPEFGGNAAWTLRKEMLLFFASRIPARWM